MSDDIYSKMKIELDFLSAIERGEIITQMTLKQKLGVSVGLINALLKRAVTKGYVKVQQAPYKRYAYYLTPQGFSEKSRLVTAYLESSMDFLRKARAQYSVIFDKAIGEGRSSFVLAGDGELAELAILSTLGKSVSRLVVLDAVSENDDVSGVKIINKLDKSTDFDLIIITDSRNSQDTFETLRQNYPDIEITWPPLLHITPDRDALIKKQGEFV